MGAARKVAMRWLEGSLASTPYFHGTSLADALEIERSGFRIASGRGRGAVLGPAVYVSAKRSWADSYAADIAERGVPAAVLVLRVKDVPFLSVDPVTWPEEVVARYRARSRHEPVEGAVDYPVLGDVARALGYGAAGTLTGTIAVFDPRSVVVVSVDRV